MSEKSAVATSKRPATNLAMASRVARVAELQWIRLRRATLQVESADVDALPPQMTFDVSQRSAHRLMDGGAFLHVSVNYTLDVLNETLGSSREALVEAEFQLRYSLLPSLAPSSAELRWFAELNGTLNSWPYWRELAQAVLSRAGLGSLTLPLWRPSAIPVDENGQIIHVDREPRDQSN